MKLLNQSLTYLSGFILLIVTIWSVVFYFSMLNEIKSSIDEELENHKRLIISKAESDTTIIQQQDFDERNYVIREIGREPALSFRNRYIDTLVYMQDDDDEEMELEPVRMLVTAFENNGLYYELKIINPMLEEDDLIKDLFWFVLLLYIVLVISIILINNIILRKLWKPFYELLGQLKNFRLGNSKNLPVIETRTKEFNDLNNTVNSLLENSIEIYEQQKQFIGNASHELQTPLAIVTNKLELLLEQNTLKEEEAAHIAGILKLIERMVKLNKSLLLLAKIENRQFLNNSIVSFNKIARQLTGDLEDLASYKNVTVELHERAELQAELDPALATIIVTNLVKNAIIHNSENGSVSITINENSLIVSNTGAKELDKDRIFERFNKTDQHINGSGLGLSIVYAICSLYNYKISYSFKEGMHYFEVVI